MSKSPSKRSGLQSRLAKTIGSPSKRGKGVGQKMPAAAGKRRAVQKAPQPAAKPERPEAKPTKKRSASVSAKSRAVAQSAAGRERRKSELSHAPAAPRANVDVGLKAEAAGSPAQGERPIEALSGSALTDNSLPALPAPSEPRPTGVPLPFTGVMEANADVHRVMTSSAAATFRFATSLARCRHPVDVWLAQIRFIRELVRPARSSVASE